MAQNTEGAAITISSSNVDLGGALRAHVRESIQQAATKYMQRLAAAPGHFAHEGGGSAGEGRAPRLQRGP